jgi:hypothetical protein
MGHRYRGVLLLATGIGETEINKLDFVFFHHLHHVCDGLGHQILLLQKKRTVIKGLPHPQCSFYANHCLGPEMGKALYFALINRLFRRTAAKSNPPETSTKPKCTK